MSKQIIKHSIFILTIVASLVMAVALAGCRDDILYTQAEIPDTDVEIAGEVAFKPLVATEVQTRSSEKDAPLGLKYRGIKSLYLFFFDSEENIVEEYCGDVAFTAVASDGTAEHVTFSKTVRAGRYYIFAVANISDRQKADLIKNVRTIDALRDYPLAWDGDINDDLEMFGVFKAATPENPIPDNTVFEDNVLLTITKRTSLHSWVRRATSKVTVDFDGTALKDGVTVYIKKATLRDVATGALLGRASRVDADHFECKHTADYAISYGTGDDNTNYLTVTNAGVSKPKDVWGDDCGIDTFHDDDAKALPCYENMQGEPGANKLQDTNGDGIIDDSERQVIKDNVPNGTYLEVEGYYVSDRHEYKSHGDIIYRFMLGQDDVKNFDLIRNHHYQITMKFKGYGNDVDWHVVYKEQYLDATYPKDVNYQGEFFKPDVSGSSYQTIVNGGHTFASENVITVTSFETDGTQNTWKEPHVDYAYFVYDEKKRDWINDTDAAVSPWLELKEGEPIDNKSKQYSYTAKMAQPEPTTIDALFPANAPTPQPYNLSSPTGNSDVTNTANCYIVGAPGEYLIPLVYGNAITGGRTDDKSAYNSEHFVNHRGTRITKPYIKDNGVNLTPSNIEVRLIWQDANLLVDPASITFEPDMFNGKGAIKFRIGTMQEGNAVIALIDKSAPEDPDVVLNRGVWGTGGSTKAIWSWHIWATRFGTDSFEKTITITNREEKKYDLMPVHLGWCSGGRKIKYYPRRKCEITFTVGEKEIRRTIIQYPHFLLPRGNHPYYQWGRKDPFVGTDVKESNKTIWTHTSGPLSDGWTKYNPPRLYNEPEKTVTNDDGTTTTVQDWRDDRRHTTTECLNVLIKNPDKWHNATRQPKGGADKDPQYVGFESLNVSYSDLWSLGGYKTIYDPCPPGYQVGDRDMFTGLIYYDKTGADKHKTNPTHWYDVTEDKMPSDYYDIGSVNSQVLEFYTDPRKLQSIIFPVSGYRDYDNTATVLSYPNPGTYNGIGFIWTSDAADATNSIHLKFKRGDMTGSDWQVRDLVDQIIDPQAEFYNTDGFAVRPVSSK